MIVSFAKLRSGGTICSLPVFCFLPSGITALIIAAKTEEIYPPNLENFVYVCDNAYSRSNIVEMEAKMLTAGDFRLVVTSSLQLLNFYSEQLSLPEEEVCMAKYFLEYSLSRYVLSSKMNSSLAGGAILLALSFYQHASEEIDNFINANGLQLPEITQSGWLMWEAAMESKRTQQFTSIERKYSNPSCHRVSLLNTHVLAIEPPVSPSN